MRAWENNSAQVIASTRPFLNVRIVLVGRTILVNYFCKKLAIWAPQDIHTSPGSTKTIQNFPVLSGVVTTSSINLRITLVPFQFMIKSYKKKTVLLRSPHAKNNFIPGSWPALQTEPSGFPTLAYSTWTCAQRAETSSSPSTRPFLMSEISPNSSVNTPFTAFFKHTVKSTTSLTFILGLYFWIQ